MQELKKRMPRPKIGLLPTGHDYYWSQFPKLKEMGLRMYASLRKKLGTMADIVAPELVDTEDKARKAGDLFKRENVDMAVIFPVGYCPSMRLVPAVKDLLAPIRILNAHEDRSYDYASADTTEYLHHEAVCCVPEFSGALLGIGKKFRVRTGPFDDTRLWDELEADFKGAAAASFFKKMNIGLIGEIYTHMCDMPVDEHRLLRATGRLLVRPEVEEIEEAFRRVTKDQVKTMLKQFRKMYDVDKTVTDEDMSLSARIAVAFDKVICKHNINAFGFYWWGEKESITLLRSQSALAVSRLSSLGVPGVTEGDVKSAMAMKIMDLLGAGGMFAEFFSMDFDENFIMMGHDGPANINMAHGRPRLQHLDVHHGKSGRGLGIDFDVKPGPVTLLNLTQFDAGPTFKIIYTVAEVIPGPILSIGNPNCRVRLNLPIHRFVDAWCQQGPEHHLVIGYGDQSLALESFAESTGFQVVKI